MDHSISPLVGSGDSGKGRSFGILPSREKGLQLFIFNVSCLAKLHSLRAQAKMALQRPSHFAETEVALIRAVMTRLTFTAMGMQDF